MSARIVLLTNDQAAARALASRLAGGPGLSLIIEQIPSGVSPYGALSRTVRAVVGDRFVDRLVRYRAPAQVRRLLAWEEATQQRADTFLMQELASAGYAAEWPTGVPRFSTTDINAEATVERIRSARPDVLVVFGAQLLRAPLLALPTRGAINAHSSLLPHYRGTRSEFWQCLHNDPEHVGITFHLVDAGVDTGHILFQHATESDWPTDPFHLRVLNTMHVLHHYPDVVQRYLDGALVAMEQPGPGGTTYRLKDHTVARRMELFQRTQGS